MTQDDHALWIPSPFFTAGREGLKPRYVILHGTAGGTSAQAIASWFQSSQANVSAHYIVGPDGVIVQCVDENNWSWANGVISEGHDPWWTSDVNPNWITISIEHVNPSAANDAPYTPAQLQASVELVQRICSRWGIPQRQADALGGITGHFSIDPVNRRNCPGPVFPWGDYWNVLHTTSGDTMLNITDTFASQFFTQTATDRWHCKQTGVDIAYGILTYYRQLNGALRLPITNEFQIIPTITAQAFEGGIVVYDPTRKFDTPPLPGDCYLAHIDNGPGQQILAHSLVAALNTQIQALQTRIVQLTSTQTTQNTPSSDVAAQMRALQSQLDSVTQQAQEYRARLVTIAGQVQGI